MFGDVVDPSIKVGTKKWYTIPLSILVHTVVVAADGRSLARALRVAGRVEPLFVDNVADLPQAIADNAKGGDVVMCMGAGSIGAVPGKVVDLLQNSELKAQEGRAL